MTTTGRRRARATPRGAAGRAAGCRRIAGLVNEAGRPTAARPRCADFSSRRSARSRRPNPARVREWFRADVVDERHARTPSCWNVRGAQRRMARRQFRRVVVEEQDAAGVRLRGPGNQVGGVLLRNHSADQAQDLAGSTSKLTLLTPGAKPRSRPGGQHRPPGEVSRVRRASGCACAGSGARAADNG